MSIKLRRLAPIIGTAAVAAAVCAAPIASASPDTQAPGPQRQACMDGGSATVCQSPGNVQINDAPPPVQFYPYGGDAFLL
jgi:hypothetical protein